MGICLGSQLMANALGSRVFAGPHKEIGWGQVTLTNEGSASCLAPLADADAVVLHWHGDTFDLPDGAARLAWSYIYDNQAFAYGQQVLALQFHVEADPRSLKQWYVGHSVELAAAGISVADLRSATAKAADRSAPRRNRSLPHGYARSFSLSIARPQPAPDRHDRRQGTAARGRRSSAGRCRRCTGGPDCGS